jgi:hypothetical protein
MISIDELFPRVLPFVVGCSEPMARQALLDSAIKFCDKTDVIRESLDAFPTVSGLPNYDIETPNNQMRVSRILSVTVDDHKIFGVFEEDADKLPEQEGKPSTFYTRRIDSVLELYLNPVPDISYSVVVHASFTPTVNATALADDLINRWYEGIVTGAISYLASLPNMPFSNPALAAQKEIERLKACDDARRESYYGRIRGGSRIRQRPFA